MLTEELVDLAIQSTISGAALQTNLRTNIEQALVTEVPHAIAEEVAGVVSQYRTKMQDWIEDASDPVRGVRMKKVNNICNDISRISRDMLGYSIVRDASHKEGYKYGVSVPKLRATRKVTILEPTMTFPIFAMVPEEKYQEVVAELAAKDVIIEDLNKQINGYGDLLEHPTALFRHLLNKHSTDTLGKAMVEVLKEVGV